LLDNVDLVSVLLRSRFRTHEARAVSLDLCGPPGLPRRADHDHLAAAAPDSLHRANVQRYFTDALPENLVCDRPMISGLR